MCNVKVDKANSYLQYESDYTSWEATMVTDLEEKEIVLLGTTRIITNAERHDIIAKLLNKYVFGNYLNFEPNIWKCKLKNRGQEKYEELNLDRKSYSIISEEILEYSRRDDDSEMLRVLRALYISLKIEVTECIKTKKIPEKSRLEFTFNGNKKEYNLFFDILEFIKDEVEDALSRYSGKDVKMRIIKGKLKNKKANTLFLIKGA